MIDKEFNRRSVYSQCYKRFRKISNPIYGECELLKLDNSNLSKLNISPEKKKDLSKSKFILLKQRLVNDIEEINNDLEILRKRKMIHHENLIEMLDYEVDKKSDFCSTFFTLKVYYKFYLTNLREQVQLRSEDNHHFTEKELVGFLYDTLDVLAYLQSHGVPHGDIRPELLFFDEVEGKTVTKLGERMSEHNSMGECQLNHLMNKSKIYMSPKLYHSLSRGNPACEHNVYKSDLFSLGLVFLEMGNLLNVQDVYNQELGEITKEKLDGYYEKFYARYMNSPLLCSSVKVMIQLTEKKRSNGKRLYKRLPDMEEIKQYYEEVEKIQMDIPSIEREGVQEIMDTDVVSDVNTIPKSTAFGNRQTFEPDPELQKIYHQNQVEMQNNGEYLETKLDEYFFDEEEYRKNFESVPKYSEYDEFHKETMKKIQLERMEEEQNLREVGYENPVRNRARVQIEPEVSLSPYRKMKQRENEPKYVENPFDTHDEDKENVDSYNPNTSTKQKSSSWRYKKTVETQPKVQKVYEYATFNANPNIMSTATEKSMKILKNLESNNSMKSNGKFYKRPVMNLLSQHEDETTKTYESDDGRSDNSEMNKHRLNLFDTNRSEFTQNGSPEIKKPAIEEVKLGSPIHVEDNYVSGNSHGGKSLGKYEDNNSVVSHQRSIQRLNTVKNLRNDGSRIMSMKTVTKDHPHAKVYEDNQKFMPMTPSKSKLSYVRRGSDLSYQKSPTPKSGRKNAFSPNPKEMMQHYSPQSKIEENRKPQEKPTKLSITHSQRQIRRSVSPHRRNPEIEYSSNKNIKLSTPNRSTRASNTKKVPYIRKTPSKSPSRRTISPHFHHQQAKQEYGGKFVKRIVHRIDGTQEVITDGTPYIPSHQINQKSENQNKIYQNYEHVKRNLRNYTPVKLETFLNNSDKIIDKSPKRGSNLSGYHRNHRVYKEKVNFEKSPLKNYRRYHDKSPLKQYPKKINNPKSPLPVYSKIEGLKEKSPLKIYNNKEKSPLRNYKQEKSPLRNFRNMEESKYIRDYIRPTPTKGTTATPRVIRVNGQSSKKYKVLNYSPKDIDLPMKKSEISVGLNSTNLLGNSVEDYNPYYRPFGADNTEDETAYEFENPYT